MQLKVGTLQLSLFGAWTEELNVEVSVYVHTGCPACAESRGMGRDHHSGETDPLSSMIEECRKTSCGNRD